MGDYYTATHRVMRKPPKLVEVGRAVDLNGWKVVRLKDYRDKDKPTKYLTAKGWKKQDITKNIKYDETMIWDEEEIQALFYSLLDEVFRGRLKVHISSETNEVVRGWV